MARMNFARSALAVTALAAAGLTHAATLRIAGANDILTFDPAGQNHQTTLAYQQMVYESLIRYDEKYQITPSLATKWTFMSPTQLRFELRKGVKFHDGAPFTADDVVFSLTRTMTPPSNLTSATQSVKEVKKVDDHTVDVILKGPSPVVLRELVEARIMNKAWAEKNNATKAQDYKAKEENFASRNANGTGPFTLVGWQPDTKTTLKKNPNWWDKPKGNIDEIVFTPIKSAATRSAALISGQVDMVVDPPVQDLERIKRDPNIHVIEGPENRTIFFGFDQFRDELMGSNIKGKNPLKDKRVRQALYQAVDMAAIEKTVMRGLGKPTGTMIAPMVNGWTKELGARVQIRRQRGQETAGRRRLPARLRADAGLPERPLCERRSDLPGRDRDVDAHRRQDQVADQPDVDPLGQDPEVRRQRLHAGLGRGHVRRAVFAGFAHQHGRPQGRRGRQLQLRPYEQPDGRQPDPADQDRDGREKAQRHDPRGAADREERLQLPAAARPDSPLGHAQGRDHAAPRGRSADAAVDKYQVTSP